MALGAGLLAAWFAAATLLFMPRDSAVAPAIALAAFATLTRFLTRLARESDRVEGRYQRYALLDAASALGGFALGAGLAVWSKLGAAAPFAGAALACGAIALFDLRGMLREARGARPERERALRYAGYGFPLAAALALELAVQTSTRGLIAWSEGAASIGSYAAATGIFARPLDLLFSWAGLTFAPALMAAYDARDGRGFNASARDCLRMLMVLATPAAVGIVLVAEPLAAILIGEGLRAEAVKLAPWSVVFAICAGLQTYYFSEAFQLTRRTGLRAALMLVPAGLQIALCALLLPHFGVAGAAAAAAVSACTGMLLLAFVGRKLLPLPLASAELVRIASAAMFMGLAVLYVEATNPVVELVLKSTVGALVYGAAALAFDLGDARGRLRAMLAPNLQEAAR
jgi:O-antigen/teichoic acid export membrane protein